MADIIWHQLPKDLCNLICGYVGNDRIKPWVKALGPINYRWLSINPSAMDLLMANPDKIDYNSVSAILQRWIYLWQIQMKLIGVCYQEIHQRLNC
jgi:hypothetical protein